jgi:hypothetical protein
MSDIYHFLFLLSVRQGEELLMLSRSGKRVDSFSTTGKKTWYSLLPNVFLLHVKERF